MKRAVARQDAVTLRMAVPVVESAHQLDAALHRLGTRVAEEDAVRKTVLCKALGETFAFGNAIKVRTVPKPCPLGSQSLDQVGMAMAERRNGDPAGKVQKASPVRGIQIRTLASLERKVRTSICRQQRLAHDLLLCGCRISETGGRWILPFLAPCQPVERQRFLYQG